MTAAVLPCAFSTDTIIGDMASARKADKPLRGDPAILDLYLIPARRFCAVTRSNLAQMHGLDRVIAHLLRDQPGALARGQDVGARPETSLAELAKSNGLAA
jgi:hypothetical protein